MDNYNKSQNYNKSINEENNKILIKNNANDSKNTTVYYYFYILRIISSFAVVLIHVSSEYYYNLKINSYDWKIAYYYDGISRFSVPIFFMISGALFLNRDISFRNMFTKYIKKILIHLIIWSFIYSIFNQKLSNINIKILIFKFIKTHYHLWYLFATIELYIIVPFLREISKKKELLKIFILLSFIYTFFIPTLNDFLSYNFKDFSNIINIFFQKINLNYLKGNIFYFIFGYYLNNKIDIKILQKIFIYLLGLFGIYFTTKLSYIISIKRKIKINYFNNNNLNVCIYSISIFIYIKSRFNKIKLKKRTIHFIKLISNNTFGIYLIHPLIIESMKNYKINKLFLYIKLVYRIPLVSSFIFISSLLISRIIKFIPIIGNNIF